MKFWQILFSIVGFAVTVAGAIVAFVHFFGKDKEPIEVLEFDCAEDFDEETAEPTEEDGDSDDSDKD